ncbi:hypothetical protein [Flammeovirga aprica]|uniref:Uncharacterized protein n=1 Tax=Flammeovirga aprica JL-4 TaxID=694437 RepID=A0A7X9NZ14_9BACT|nr:hypothetical protein [Flammeovirga aprica]NME66536.1 hypothetical protein [Flammeovirga aprica JL-4]
MKTVFALIAVLIITIAAATTILYTSAAPGYDDVEITISKVDIEAFQTGQN